MQHKYVVGCHEITLKRKLEKAAVTEIKTLLCLLSNCFGTSLSFYLNLSALLRKPFSVHNGAVWHALFC